MTLCLDCNTNEAENGSKYCWWCDLHFTSDDPQNRKREIEKIF